MIILDIQMFIVMFALTPGEYHKSTISQGGGGVLLIRIYILLAPPAERQRSFSNTDLSVVRLSVRPSVRLSVRQDWGGEGSISETLQ